MYRFLVDLLQPYTLGVLLVFVGLLWARRRLAPPRRGWRLAMLGAIVLWLSSMQVVGYLAIGPLERRYPPFDAATAPRTAPLVVLAGAVERPSGVLTESVLTFDSQLRCEYGARLYRELGARKVYVTGGRANADEVGPPIAELMREHLMRRGVAAADIVVEGESMTTHENAAFTAKLLRENGASEIILVTTASHLPRAVRSFEAEGLVVLPAGCCTQYDDFKLGAISFVPTLYGANLTSAAFHEWAGILYYWATGRL